MERARESLGRVAPVCNPRGRGAYLCLPNPKSTSIERGGCVNLLGSAPPAHTGLHVSVMPDHHASTHYMLVILYSKYLTGYQARVRTRV